MYHARPALAAALAASLAATAFAAPLQTQSEGPDQPIEAVPVLPDQLSLAQGAAARGDPAEALSRYLRLLSGQPDNVAALAGAGRAALAMGDTNAAAGFFARGEKADPRNGPIKAGLAATMVQNGEARAALKFFADAVALGVPPADIAADRGLAYDLRGDTRRAQADYRLALAGGPDDALTRRLALSQAIGGDRAGALATLDPLLRKQDVAAWRTRAFVKAVTGDVAGAEADAGAVLRADQAAALNPYFARLPALKAAEKAAAVHLGRFPVDKTLRDANAAPPPRLIFDRAVAVAPVTVIAAAPPPAPLPVESAAPPPVDPARARAEPPVSARARRLEAAAAAKAKREKAAEQAEARAAKANPARHWVQVAGGANKKDLGRAWADLKKKWPGQLAGRSPWTTHYRFTNRLLIGPFPTSDAAQDWVGARKAEGLASFRVETNAGDAVERVKG